MGIVLASLPFPFLLLCSFLTGSVNRAEDQGKGDSRCSDRFHDRKHQLLQHAELTCFLLPEHCHFALPVSVTSSRFKWRREGSKARYKPCLPPSGTFTTTEEGCSGTHWCSMMP